MSGGFVVESAPTSEKSTLPSATLRVYVMTEERAKEIVEQGRLAGAMRTYRAVSYDEMPEKARENMERARLQG